MAYLPLSTANLPDPVIDPAQGASPEDYFNTVTYDGLYETLGSNQLVTGVGFQPDFTWIKCRNLATNHILVDVLRYQSNTDNNMLYSNSTTAELDEDDKFRGFDTDGFNVGFFNDTGNIAGSYVAWNWKANGSGVTNTDGSITSTVSANTTSGFSIVSWTGNATQSTIGHGLNSAPDFLVVKNRDDGTSNWNVWHTDLTTDYSLYLNLTNAENPNAPLFFGDGTNMVVPTDSVFTVGSNSQTNGNTNDMIAYCFHSVEGFSKFGSYVGNGSTDGVFVYTGFRPAFVMVKVASAAGERWQIHDTSREAYNGAIAAQFADGALVDNTTSTYAFDILSNGFKPRTSHQGSNYNGQTIIYMAFAENPFKYSNAR